MDWGWLVWVCCMGDNSMLLIERGDCDDALPKERSDATNTETNKRRCRRLFAELVQKEVEEKEEGAG